MQGATDTHNERCAPNAAEMDQLLDEALRMTFPASDPIAIYIEPARPLDRPAAEPDAGEARTRAMNTRNDTSLDAADPAPAG